MFLKKPITSFQKKVYNITMKVPRGKVTTYAAIAKAMGNTYAARAIGNALNKNPFCEVPCHRVIRSDGSLGGYAKGTIAKIKYLRKEGVAVIKNTVLQKFIL